MNQPTRAKSTLELLLTITEWQSKCLDCDFSTHLNVVFPSFFLFPTLVSPKLILCMLMWVFTVCIPYSESRPLQHLPAYQIRCMLICQYMLWLHNKKTPTDSSGAGAFCMHLVMYDPITLTGFVRGNGTVEGHQVKTAVSPCIWLMVPNSH